MTQRSMRVLTKGLVMSIDHVVYVGPFLLVRSSIPLCAQSHLTQTQDSGLRHEGTMLLW